METKTKNIIICVVGVIVALVLIGGIAFGIIAGIDHIKTT